MKALPLIILLFIAFSDSSAQKIRFTYAGNQWQTAGTAGIDGFTFSGGFTFGTDTIIFGKSYRHFTGRSFFVREDTAAGKVYAVNFDLAIPDTSEHLLYDYTLDIGDTLRADQQMPADKVVSIDSTIINGVFHKIFNFENTALGFMRSYTVVEGIGCTNSPILPATFGACFEYSESLICFSQGGYYPTMTAPINSCAANMYVPNPFFNHVGCNTLSAPGNETHQTGFAPNPANNQVTLSTNPRSGNKVHIYDLTGKCIFTESLPANNTTVINTTTWKEGVYLILLRDDMGVSAKQLLVVQH